MLQNSVDQVTLTSEKWYYWYHNHDRDLNIYTLLHIIFFIIAFFITLLNVNVCKQYADVIYFQTVGATLFSALRYSTQGLTAGMSRWVTVNPRDQDSDCLNYEGQSSMTMNTDYSHGQVRTGAGKCSALLLMWKRNFWESEWIWSGTKDSCRSLNLTPTHTYTPPHTLSLRECFHALTLEMERWRWYHRKCVWQWIKALRDKQDEYLLNTWTEKKHWILLTKHKKYCLFNDIQQSDSLQVQLYLLKEQNNAEFDSKWRLSEESVERNTTQACPVFIWGILLKWHFWGLSQPATVLQSDTIIGWTVKNNESFCLPMWNFAFGFPGWLKTTTMT